MENHSEKKFAGKNEFIRSNIQKPVSVGDVVELHIESEGGQGDGIAKKDGFVLFVKGAKKGETCKAKVTDVKRTFALAENVS